MRINRVAITEQVTILMSVRPSRIWQQTRAPTTWHLRTVCACREKSTEPIGLPYCHYRTSMELKTFHTPPNISRAIKARGMLHPHTPLQTNCCTFFTAHMSVFFDFSLFLGNRCSNPCGYGYTNLFCMLDKTNRYYFVYLVLF